MTTGYAQRRRGRKSSRAECTSPYRDSRYRGPVATLPVAALDVEVLGGAEFVGLARDVLNEDFTAEKEESEVFKPTEWKRSDTTIARLARVTATRAGLDALNYEFPKSLP